jgi:chorismate mutase
VPGDGVLHAHFLCFCHLGQNRNSPAKDFWLAANTAKKLVLSLKNYQHCRNLKAITMNFLPVFTTRKRPVLIAGPCSAETEEQVLATARALAPQGIDLFRAGIWKPRTRPGTFEGAGIDGLHWLRRVREETGLQVATEVARGQHVEAALRHKIDVLWIGARTSVNPFSVQEISDALSGLDIPVLVKNPINADLELWIGAIERIYKVGIRRIAAVHRGFSKYGEKNYRNIPLWQIPLELKRLFPDLQIICDHSHICGRRDTLAAVAQRALDLNYDGLMTEVHPCPDEAWSDGHQQVTPARYRQMTGQLIVRRPGTDDEQFWQNLDQLRQQIDEIDDEVFELLSTRMRYSKQIGGFKRQSNISIYQPERWNRILERVLLKGKSLGLHEEFVTAVIDAIHQESIIHQASVMNRTGEKFPKK